MNSPRSPLALPTVRFLLPLLFAGCVAESGASMEALEDGGVDEGPSHDAEELGQTSQALDVKAALCAIIDKVPSVDIGAFRIDDPSCTPASSEQLFYFGSGGPGNHAETLAEATYCAIAETKYKKSPKTYETGFGVFGSRSEVKTYGRDNQARHIGLEHKAYISVFGVDVPLAYSTSTFDFQTEHQTSRNVRGQHDNYNFISIPFSDRLVSTKTRTPTIQRLRDQTGYYAQVNTDTLENWRLHGQGSFPVGPVMVTVKAGFDVNEPQVSYGNGVVHDVQDGVLSETLPRVTSWSEMADPYYLCVAQCRRDGQNFCELVCGDAPTPEMTLSHEVNCAGGCTPSYFANLEDAIVPYTGAGSGARGDLLFGDSIDNYWQYGYPGSVPHAALGETRYGLKAHTLGESTKFTFGLDVGFQAGIASVSVGTKLNYRTRSGAALRSRFTRAGDLGQRDRASVKLEVDTEVAVNLNVNMKLKLDLPLFPVEIEYAYDLLDSGNLRQTNPAAGPTYAWSINRSGESDAGTAACTAFATPETTGPTPPNMSGQDLIYDMAEANIENIHPCHVRVCVPSRANSQTGRFTNYEWDASTLQLVGTATNQSCNVCESEAALCNKDGDVLPVAPRVGTPTACGGDGPLCGGRPLCEEAEDCANPSATCASGCCVVVR